MNGNLIQPSGFVRKHFDELVGNRSLTDEGEVEYPESANFRMVFRVHQIFGKKSCILPRPNTEVADDNRRKIGQT